MTADLNRRKLTPQDVPRVEWSARYTDLETTDDGKIFLEGSQKQCGQIVDGAIVFWQGKAPVMKAADRAAKRVASWSPAKRDYARRHR